MIYLFSRLNRYVVTLFLKWFGAVLLGVSTIVLLLDMIELFRRMMTRPHVTFLHAIEVVLCQLPGELERMLPFIILSSAMLTLSKLNQHSEITAMRTAGVSLWHLLYGLIASVFLLGIINITLINPIRTTLTQRLYFVEEKLFGRKKSTVSLNSAGLWLKEIDVNEDRIFHSKAPDLHKGVFKNVTFYIFSHDGQFLRRIDADEASIHSHHWFLKNVEENNHRTDNLFLHTDLTLKMIRDSNAVPETLSFWETPHFIRLLEKSGLSTLPYRMHYYKLIAQIGLMMVMVLLAAGFCLRPVRSSRASFLISMCLLMGLFFHFMTDFIYALGLGGRLPPLLATWFPVFIGLFLSISLLLHAEGGHRHT